MHGPINVNSPNNISEWQMGFNSAFKGLTSCSMDREISNPPRAFTWHKRTTLLHARRASYKENANAFCPCLELAVFVMFDGLPCQVPGTPLPAEQDYIIGVLFNAAAFLIGSGWSPGAIVLNKHTPLLTINSSKNFSLTQCYYINKFKKT
jgi:hypothetical protein